MRTHLGYGSPHKQDSFEAHGSPLGEDEVRLTKQNLGWPAEPPFYVPELRARTFSPGASSAASAAKRSGTQRLSAYARSISRARPRVSARSCAANCLRAGTRTFRSFRADAKGMATRVASGKVMNAIAPRLPALIGGSADLDPSTYTALAGLGRLSSLPQRARATRKAPRAAAGATPAAICTSACASTGWARS